MKPQRAVVGRMDFVPRSHDAKGFGLRKFGFGAYCHVATVKVLTEMMPSVAGLFARLRVMNPNAVELSEKTLMQDSTRLACGVPGNRLKVHGIVVVMSFR